MNKMTKFVVVGFASIGKRHIEVPDAQHEAEVIAIFDIND